MSERSPDNNELIVNYMFLRQTVGWIGTLLPIVLLAGAAFTSTARPDSMSGYYYTDQAPWVRQHLDPGTGGSPVTGQTEQAATV